MGKFIIKRITTGEYYFNLLADNLQVILTSQMNSSKLSCIKSIEQVRNSCSYENYERKHTIDNKYYFVLKASDGKEIGKSEMYSSKTFMENGIESVKKNGNNKQIIEEEPYF
jgi:hypothetical protein